MNHTLRIGISADKRPRDDGLVSCRRVDLRERLFRFLLGEKRRLTVIVPGDTVKTVSIVEEGGNPDEQDE